MFERSANVFPGFEAEIQGLYREVDVAGAVRFDTYVFQESCSSPTPVKRRRKREGNTYGEQHQLGESATAPPLRAPSATVSSQ